MTDYIEEYERNVRSSWLGVAIKIMVALAILAVVYYSMVPIKEQIAYYNTFVQIGNCLCPPSNLRLIG